MEIEFTKQMVPCCRRCFRQAKIITDHVDCVVPDVLEDIGKIAFSDAQLLLKGKEITPSGARVSASMEATVFYISDSLDKVRCVKLTKDFSAEFESDEITPESYLLSSLTLQGLQPRIVNARKISVQFSAEVLLDAWREDQLSADISAGINEGCALQLLEGESDCISMAEITEKSFVISEQLPLAEEQDGPMSLICSNAKLLYTDHQMIGSKVLLKGGAEFRFGYETDSSSYPRFSEQCVSFSVLIDAPGEETEMSSLILQPTALYANLGDAINGGHVVEMELHAVAQVGFSQTQKLHYITDAYSTRFPLRCLEESREICRSRTTEYCTVSAEEKSEYEGQISAIAAQHAEILSSTIRDGKGIASAVVSAVVQTEDGTLGYVQKLLTFESALPCACCEISSLQMLSFNVKAEETELLFSAELQFAFLTNESGEVRYVRAVEIDTETPFPLSSRPALVAVRRKDRSLWSMAKQYSSSMEAIEALSKKYELPPDLLLIPKI